jgi:transcriptional regulator with XRE-family HTH domain
MKMDEFSLRRILSNNVRHYRALKNLSQLELAGKLDISTNFLSDIERCKAWLSPLTLVKLAEALDVEPFELLKECKYLEKNEKTLIEEFADDTFVEISRALDKVRKVYLSERAN